MSEYLGGLSPAIGEDPIWRLWRQLPEPWRRRVIGEDIDNWAAITEIGERRLNLTGLPDQIAAEMAWMAHWQAVDGTRSSVLALNQLANILRRAMQQGYPFPPSIRAMDADTAAGLQRWFYATRWGRLLPHGAQARLRVVFRFARLALLARCHNGPWWELDHWHPRCDPRIPLTAREPVANYGCAPGDIVHPWLRSAVKWCLGTQLEAGTLRWTTISQERLHSLRRFDNWLGQCLEDPADVLGDPAAAAQQSSAFRRWVADPENRMTRDSDRRHVGKPVGARQVNDDVRAVAELFAFVAANPAEARTVLGTGPWDRVTHAHAAIWLRQVTRIPHSRELKGENYIDDRALAQIPAVLPLLGLPREEQMLITRGDGTQVMMDGLDDPQAMRMILLQILTGRRASEIRTCAFDCLSTVPDRAVTDAEGEGEGERIARFHYAQSKIDIAPDTILVGREVTDIIEEQQQWVREKFPDGPQRYLFLQRTGNRQGDKPYASGTYNWMLREFSDRVQVTDGNGWPIKISHTHRFRHTRLTRLAELGLPVHVLQRYAGHATPTMTMHYIAARDAHAEQAFLATTKLKADGTAVRFSRNDHDSMHLFDRADRILPNGWCLLPPLQSCDKGNACLTCSVFVTDSTHKDVLRRQLRQGAELIAETTAAFEERHGQPMPGDNIWLVQRHAEQQALTRLLDALPTEPDCTAQGGGCRPGTGDAGPVPLILEPPHYRRMPQQ